MLKLKLIGHSGCIEIDNCLRCPVLFYSANCSGRLCISPLVRDINMCAECTYTQNDAILAIEMFWTHVRNRSGKGPSS